MPRKVRSQNSTNLSRVQPVLQKTASFQDAPSSAPDRTRRHTVSCSEPMSKDNFPDFVLSFLEEESGSLFDAPNTDEDEDMLGTSLTNLEWLSLLASERSHPSETSDWITDHTIKPPFSYASLIAKAILSSPDRKRTLSEIYDYVSDNFPYYANAELVAWRNCIRHNLSINKSFVRLKSPGADEDSAKGSRSSYWTIGESALVDFSPDGVYKKKYPKPASQAAPRRRRNSTKSSSESPVCGAPLSSRESAVQSPAPTSQYPDTPPMPTPKGSASPPAPYPQRSLTPAANPSKLSKQSSVGAPYPRTVLRSQSMCSLSSDASAQWAPSMQVKSEHQETCALNFRSATPPVTMPSRAAHQHRPSQHGQQYPERYHQDIHFAPSSAPVFAPNNSAINNYAWSPLHVTSRTFSSDVLALPPTPSAPFDDISSQPLTNYPDHPVLAASNNSFTPNIALDSSAQQYSSHDDMDELLDMALSQEHNLHNSISSPSLFDGLQHLSLSHMDSLPYEVPDAELQALQSFAKQQGSPPYAAHGISPAWEAAAASMLAEDLGFIPEELMSGHFDLPHEDMLRAATHHSSRRAAEEKTAQAAQMAEPRYRVRKTSKRCATVTPATNSSAISRGPITLQIDGSHPFTRSIGAHGSINFGSSSSLDGFGRRASEGDHMSAKSFLEAVDSGLAASP